MILLVFLVECILSLDLHLTIIYFIEIAVKFDSFFEDNCVAKFP